MKVNIEKNNLLSLLSKTQNIIEKRNSMQVLVNILLEAKGDQLKVYATNLEVSLITEVPAQIDVEGKAAVNAKSFFDIVKELPDGLIELARQENNWLKLIQGKAVYNIVGVSPDEYPVFPSYSSDHFTHVDRNVFLEMIDKTIYSVSNDETRYHLNGVFFENFKTNAGWTYRMVATDGHRLSLVDRKSDNEISKMSPSHGVIIPRKGLQEIKKILESTDGDFEMAVEGSQLIVKNLSTIVMIRLIEGKYPNYKQLIPKNLDEHILVRKNDLLSSLKRVSLLSNQKSKGVTLSLSKGKMKITSNNPELGDAKEEIEVQYQGKDIKIGFNARYMLDVLGSINEDEVVVDLKDQLSPGLLRPSNDKFYTCVIMPMRI